MIRLSRGDAFILLSTFLLTVFEYLTLGIAVGVTLGAFLFLHRMVELSKFKAEKYFSLRTRWMSWEKVLVMMCVRQLSRLMVIR